VAVAVAVGLGENVGVAVAVGVGEGAPKMFMHWENSEVSMNPGDAGGAAGLIRTLSISAALLPPPEFRPTNFSVWAPAVVVNGIVEESM